MKKTVFVFVVSILIPLGVFAETFQFENNLKEGDNSTDVIELQKILNSSNDTYVSVYGPGSSGNETSFFGSLTKKAVIRFQEKYKSEILLPVGLSNGTGYVGGSTKNKLNSLSIPSNSSLNTAPKKEILTQEISSGSSKNFNGISVVAENKAESYFGSSFKNLSNAFNSGPLDKTILAILPSFAKEVRLYNTDPYQAKPGQKITVNGIGFAEKDNIFSFGSVKTDKVSCSYSTSCDVLVPNSVSFGNQGVVLENSQGSSANQGYVVSVFITNNPMTAASIENVFPNSLSATDINKNLLIKGENFTSGDNYIYTPLGRVGPYSSSDGKTISFSLGGIKDVDKMLARVKLLKQNQINIPIAISNEYGMSSPVPITVIINK